MRILTSLLALSVSPVFALTTVATVGATQPLFKQKPLQHAPTQTQINKIVQETINQRYFVKTPSLSVGHVIEEARVFKLTQPIAIVGCDIHSERWLSHYATRLKVMGATGYVVNCDGKAQYEALKSQSTITLVPTTGGDFKKTFGINHYPVLITQGGVFQ